MNLHKKAIIWDLDNTLYEKTPEFGRRLDETTAQAVINLGAKIDFDTAVKLVEESYREFRDGGEIFVREYGIDKHALYMEYHKLKPIEEITPYKGLAERLKQIPINQYIFTYSSREAAEKIIKHLGLWDIFKGKFYSVEDFKILSKNANEEVYLKLCKAIGIKPEECIFVDDSYSNLEIPKKIGMTTIRIYYNSNSSKDKTYIDAAFKGINSFLDQAIPIINSCGC